MIHAITVHFSVLKNRINRKGLCPIRCRVSISKKRKDFNTGLFIAPEQWDDKLCKALPNTDNELYVNNQLKAIQHELERIYLKLSLGNEEVTLDKVFTEYKGEKKTEDLLIVSLEAHQVRYAKLIGIDITKTTWEKYTQTITHLKLFLRHSYKKNDVVLSSLKLKFLQDFEFFLKTQLGFKQSTINKTIQRFRKMLKHSIADGKIPIDPFMLYKPKPYRKEIIYLDQDELDSLVKHNFGQNRIQKVKDCFVFCCYTGLAFKEMSQLKSEHIIKGFDGKKWISITRQKTNKPLSIPLLPIAENILNKYANDSDYLLPKLSNQRFNSYLKEIAELLSIDKPLTHHVGRKTFATTVLLFNDVPMEIVSTLLGHSSISTTQKHYGKVVDKKVSQEMDRLRDKLK